MGRSGYGAAHIFRAWHATYYNSRSIGIEMVGFAGQASTWTAANLAAVQNLCAYLVRKYPTIPIVHPTTNANDYPDQRLNLPGIVAHGQIQPWNRTDPGPYFPWTDFMNAVKARVANPTITLTNTTSAYARASATFESKNFGAEPTLAVKRHTSTYYTRESFLKFDLSGILAVSKAKLRLYGKLSDASNASVLMQVFGHANTTWSESTLTWKNRPVASTAAIASATIAGTASKWYEIDLTNYLKAEKAAGRNVVTLVLRNPNVSNSLISFNSDDATSNRPQLVVTT